MDKQVFVDFLNSMPPFYGYTTQELLDEIRTMKSLRTLLLEEFDKCVKNKDDKAVWFQYLTTMPGDSRNSKGEYRILEFYKNFPHVKLDYKMFIQALKVPDEEFKCRFLLALPKTKDQRVLYKVGQALEESSSLKKRLFAQINEKRKKKFLACIDLYQQNQPQEKPKVNSFKEKPTLKLITCKKEKKKPVKTHIKVSTLKNSHTKRENSTIKTPFCEECNELWGSLAEKTINHEYIVNHDVRSRFSDILACNHKNNLITVCHQNEEVAIHANMITLGKDRFILAQYPCMDRISCFLKSILEYEVEDVIDLTQDQDLNGLKRYYHFGKFDDTSVKVLSNPKLKFGLKISEFEIQVKERCKTVRHIRFEDWKNHCTLSCKEFAHLVDSLDQILEKKKCVPLVHCSAGVGRSAVVIAGLHLKREMLRQEIYDRYDALHLLFETLWTLRVQRGPMTAAGYNQVNLLLRYAMSLIH